MRCINCHREMNADALFCPYCGKAVKAVDLDELSGRIGDKVDRYFSSEGEDIRNIDDGVEIQEGRMELGDTINLSPEANDTVFHEKKPAVKPVSYELTEEDLNDFAEDEPYEEELPEEEPFEEEPFDEEPFEEEPDDDPPKSHFWVVFVIAAAVLLLLAGIFWFIFIRDPGSPNPVTPTSSTQETETTEAVKDVISCSVEDGAELQAPASITLTSSSGFRMYYTLDGTTPNINSTRYVDAITIRESDLKNADKDYTLKVVSYSGTSMKSGEIELGFKVKLPDVKEPKITPSSGNYDQEQYIYISAESGAAIYYTYDGTTPTAESTRYNGAIEMKKGNNVLSAIAVKNGRTSKVASCVFNLEIKPKYDYTQASNAVKQFLKAQGKVDDDNLTTASGGYCMMASQGTREIDDVNHYIIRVTEYDKDKKEVGMITFAVNDQTLEIQLVDE